MVRRDITNPVQPREFLVFLFLAMVCVGTNYGGQMFFPGVNAIPRILRALVVGLGVLAIAFGSECLLARHFHGEITLGLRPSAKSLAGFVVGGVGAVVMVGAIAAGVWFFSPFHFDRGAATVHQILPDVQNYFFGNFGEELVFRGYLLIVLARRFGLNIALVIIACVFGLFHLPGLSGAAALKMVLTTAAFSYIFAGAFLASGTIWTAVALHFFSNVFLHSVTGLGGGDALLHPVMQDPMARGYDPGFWICLVLPVAIAYPLLSFRSSMRLKICAQRPTIAD